MPSFSHVAFAALFAMTASPTPSADDAADIVEAIRPCINIHPADRYIGVHTEVRATIKNGVVTDVEIVSYAPPTASGKRVADGIVDAVRNCGPYGKLTQEFSVEIDLRS